GPILVEPEHRIPEVGARIMDLQEPTSKMSTTGGTEAGTVLVLDDPKTVTKKIKSAVTDSGTEVKRGDGKEGIENLIQILAVGRLGEIVSSDVTHVGETGDLDLETVTEFLVLIAALCELKSRLLLPHEEGADELGPEAAADELLARMLEYRRYREAATMLSERFERDGGVM